MRAAAAVTVRYMLSSAVERLAPVAAEAAGAVAGAAKAPGLDAARLGARALVAARVFILRLRAAHATAPDQRKIRLV